MSKRHYPYLSSKKKLEEKKQCEKCDKQATWELEWQNSWFRGDDEIEWLCDEHMENSIAETEAYHQKQRLRNEQARKREAEFWAKMKSRLEEKYSVKYLTEYQWRINDVVDIYPVNRRYHILETNKRGDYRDMHHFLSKLFGRQNARQKTNPR